MSLNGAHKPISPQLSPQAQTVINQDHHVLIATNTIYSVNRSVLRFWVGLIKTGQQ